MGDLPRQIPPAPRLPPEAEGFTGQAGVRREEGRAAAEGDELLEPRPTAGYRCQRRQ